MRIPLTLLLLTLTITLSQPSRAASDLTCTDLRCEFRTNPIGIDRDQPRLSWRVESPTRGQKYIAHRLLVASSAEKLAANEGDLWDSQRVDETILSYRRYGGQQRTGKPLRSGQEVHWKVMVWDVNDVASAWSAPARFTMALVGGEDWKAEWISYKDSKPLPRTAGQLHLPAPRYYRKEFKTTRKVKRALAFATALGIYDLHLNGRQVGEAYFAPGWSDYHQRAYYNTYEVTDQLVDGENCLGAVVADGWYAGYLGVAKRHGYGPFKTGRNIYGKTPALLVQLHIEYEDGSSETVVTDASWQVGTGPEREADLLMGESYDATAEVVSWSKPGFQDDQWENALPAAATPAARALFVDSQGRRSANLGFQAPSLMEAYPVAPIRVTEELAAKSVKEARPGVWIFDFGQNFAGNVRLQVKGEKGQTLTLRYGEMLHPDGSLMTENLHEARATDTYTCKGDPQGESWSPRFTYHGFRYAELSGLKEKPDPGTLTGLVIHNDLPRTSGFECSDPLVNAIYQNSVWTHRANFVDVPTNCPQRDERLAWTGDGQLSMSAGCLHLDARAFYGKWMRDLQEARTKEGYYPNYAPHPYAHGSAPYAAAWSDAGIIGPYVLWRMFGERQVAQNRWFAIDKYMKARLNADRALDGTRFGAQWGDLNHLDDPTPPEFIDLCYLGLDVRLMMDLASITSGPIAHNTYKGVLVTILENFRKKYIGEDGALTVKSQTAHVLALRFGLVPDENRARILEDLLKLIEAGKSDSRSGMTTGLLGTKALLTVLSQSGQTDAAIQLLQSRKFPSWGYSVEQGATTLWENPDAYSREHGFKGVRGNYTAASNSFSHLRATSVSEWLISSLAGIATGTPGFRRILLQPTVPSGGAVDGIEPIKWVRAHYDSARGRIAVHWKKRDDGSLLYEVTIPAHCSALLKLPRGEGQEVFESDKPLADASPTEIAVIKEHPQDGSEWLLVESGSYRFEVK